MSKPIKVEYEFVKGSEEVLAKSLVDWMAYLAEKRTLLRRQLKSKEYRSIYKDIKSKELLLAEFILYD